VRFLDRASRSPPLNRWDRQTLRVSIFIRADWHTPVADFPIIVFDVARRRNTASVKGPNALSLSQRSRRAVAANTALVRIVPFGGPKPRRIMGKFA